MTGQESGGGLIECVECHGDGLIQNEASIETCPFCDGDGELPKYDAPPWWSA